jgi:small subunit ribosomal protein S4
MIIKSKYKIARRLNTPVFEKTQTQKYALRDGRRAKRNFARSNFGIQLVEKQKVRYTYCLTAKQFGNYVKKILSKKGTNQQEALFAILEKRLDNAVYRAGFAPTRLASKQMVTHGHIMINGKKVNIPSYEVKVGEVISIRPGSQNAKLFEKLAETLPKHTTPSWLKTDLEKRVITVQGQPQIAGAELQFNLAPVLEFYSR